MNLQRWILVIATALLGTLLYAVSTNAFPKWTILLGLAAVFLTHLTQALTQAVQIPPADPASKVSTSVRPPPLPLLIFTLGILEIFGLPLAGTLVGCWPAPLTPAETTTIVETSAGIAKCQAEGRRTNSFRAYSACMCTEKLHSDIQCAVDSVSAPLVTDAGKDVGHGDL